MVPTPHDDPSLLAVWKGLESAYLSRGLSLRQAHVKIGIEHQVSSTTVRIYLDPAYCRRQYVVKQAWRRTRGRIAPSIQWKRSGEYHRVLRNLAYYVRELYRDARGPMQLSDIASGLQEETGLTIAPRTLELVLSKYRILRGHSPIQAVGYPRRGEDARYRLNGEFYRRRAVRAPGYGGDGGCYWA